MRRLLALLAVVLTLAAGCSDDGGLTLSDLEGRTFTVTEVDGPDLVAGTEPTVAFDADGIGLYSGCNSGGGGVQVTDGELVVGSMAFTEIGCDGPVGAQEAWFFESFRSPLGITLDEDVLVLTGDGTVIMASDAGFNFDAEVEGRTFEVTHVDGVDRGGEARLFVRIFAGFFGITADCNGVGGEYALDGDTVAVPEPSTRNRGCGYDLIGQEPWLADFLRDGARIEIEQGELTLVGEDITVSAVPSDRNDSYTVPPAWASTPSSEPVP